MNFYKMKGVRLGPVLVYSTAQEKALGEQLATAVSEGRLLEVRQGDGKSILVLLSAADDLGHVYEIDLAGKPTDIGTTEKPGGAR